MFNRCSTRALINKIQFQILYAYHPNFYTYKFLKELHTLMYYTNFDISYKLRQSNLCLLAIILLLRDITTKIQLVTKFLLLQI